MPLRRRFRSRRRRRHRCTAEAGWAASSSLPPPPLLQCASSSPLPLLPPPATAAAAAAGLLPSSPYLHTPVPLSLHPLPTRRLPTPSLPSHLFPAHSPNRCPSIQPPGGGGGGAPQDGWLGCSVAASAAAGDAARLIWAPARAGPKLPPAHAARRWPGGTSPEAKSPQQASAQ